MEFDSDTAFRPPFSLEVSTPSSRFLPVHSAKVKLNGVEVAGIEWPKTPTVCVEAALRKSNKIEFGLNGPAFGSLEITVRGSPA
jgi:hypothetical protein